MASKVAQIVDAVVTQLNTLSLNQSYTATKTYNPEFDVKNASTLQVQVSPISYETQKENRIQTRDDIVISIGLQKKISIDTTTGSFTQSEVEAMMETVEDMLNGIRGFDIDAPIRAHQTSAIAQPLFYPDHLYDHAIYTGIILLSYYTSGTNN